MVKRRCKMLQESYEIDCIQKWWWCRAQQKKQKHLEYIIGQTYPAAILAYLMALINKSECSDI